MGTAAAVVARQTAGSASMVAAVADPMTGRSAGSAAMSTPAIEVKRKTANRGGVVTAVAAPMF